MCLTPDHCELAPFVAELLAAVITSTRIGKWWVLAGETERNCSIQKLGTASNLWNMEELFFLSD